METIAYDQLLELMTCIKMYYHHHAVALGEDKIDNFLVNGKCDIPIHAHFISEWFYELREEEKLNSRTK